MNAKQTATRILKEVFRLEDWQYELEAVPSGTREWVIETRHKLTGRQAGWNYEVLETVRLHYWLHEDRSGVLLGFSEGKYKIFYAEVK